MAYKILTTSSSFGKVDPAPLALLEMGMPDDEAKCTVRISISRQNTKKEITITKEMY